MNVEDALQRAVRAARRAIRNRPDDIGVVGDGAGNVYSDTNLNVVWVRLHGDQNKLVQAFCPNTVTPANDQTVSLRRRYEPGAPYAYEIVGVSTDLIQQDDDAVLAVALHAVSHMLMPDGTGGNDPVWVYEEALIPLKPIPHEPADKSLYVEYGNYLIDDVLYYFSGGDSPNINANGYSIDMLILDATGTLSWVEGRHYSSGVPATVPVKPAGAISLCGVYVKPGMTQITRLDMLPLRALFTAGGSGGSSGGLTLLAIDRWEAPSGTTTFDFSDVAEMVLALSIDGVEVDPHGYTVSDDGHHVTLGTALAATSVVTAQYVVLQI